jgi:two-component system, response regulator
MILFSLLYGAPLLVGKKMIEVLLVEDNPDDTKLVADILKKRHPGILIECVESIEAGLAFIFNTGKYAHRAAGSTPNLIILDLGLPKQGGMEFLRVIKAYVRTQVIPIVVLTGASEDPKVLESYQVGANAYVVKSHDANKFIQDIENIGAFWLKTNRPSPSSAQSETPTRKPGTTSLEH